MRNVNQVIPGNLSTSSPSTQSTPRSEAQDELLKEILKELKRMNLLPNITADIAQSWRNGLSDLSEFELRTGLRKAENFTGYFSRPAFRELCRITPDDLGLPDPRSAYLEACKAKQPKRNQKYSHPIVYWTGVHTGWFELANFPEHKIFPLFNLNYDKLVKRILAGENLAVPFQKAIEQTEGRELTPAENKQRLAELISTVNL